MAAHTIDDLITAVGQFDAEAVAVLAADADLLDARCEGETPLTLASCLVTSDLALPSADAGDAAHAVVEALVAAGADPTIPNAAGWAPLHFAGFAGNSRLVRTLLDAGASPEATVGEVAGATPLSFALFYAHRETGWEIARDVRAPDDLRSAAGLDDVAGIDRWLGADGTFRAGGGAGMPFTAPLDGFPPRSAPIDDQLTIDESLTWASRSGSLAAMELLVGRGANVNANPYRGTALLWAVFSDDALAAQWLIDQGADVDLRHDFGGADHGKGATALHLAAQFGCEDCIEVLLAAGADRTVEDANFRATPAEWAAHVGNDELAERLAAPGG